MNESHQQILTAAVMHEAGVSVPLLWVRYQGIGGTAMQNAVTAYLNGYRVLPVAERDLLSQALNEPVRDRPSSPQAPSSDAPLAHEPGL